MEVEQFECACGETRPSSKWACKRTMNVFHRTFREEENIDIVIRDGDASKAVTINGQKLADTLHAMGFTPLRVVTEHYAAPEDAKWSPATEEHVPLKDFKLRTDEE